MQDLTQYRLKKNLAIYLDNVEGKRRQEIGLHDLFDCVFNLDKKIKSYSV